MLQRDGIICIYAKKAVLLSAKVIHSMKKIFSILLVLCLVQAIYANRVIVGAEQTKEYLSDLKGKRVALFSNHTGLVIQGKDTIHTLDWL